MDFETLQLLRKDAWSAYNAGRLPSVVELLDAYLKRRTDDGFMWFLYGDSLRIMGMMSAARDALRTALRHAPRRRRYRVQGTLGKLYSEWGKRALAEKYYSRATQARNGGSELAWIWQLRGVNLAKMEEFHGSCTCLKFATELDNEDPDVFHSLGAVLCALKQYADSIVALDRAIALRGGDFPAALKLRNSMAGIAEVIDRIATIEYGNGSS
ncbi:MAG: hypothetical protein SGJ19_19975 [Planctomycetia bacterium]|nr:hypothetical protein [Planctomycetia bacterium]